MGYCNRGKRSEICKSQSDLLRGWTAVLGISAMASSTTSNTPVSGWTRYRYGTTSEAYSAQGATHNISTQESMVMAWFGLTCTSRSCYSRSNSGSSGGTGNSEGSGTMTLTTVVTTAAGLAATAGSGSTIGAALYGQW